MTVQAEEYMDKLVEYEIIKIFAICAVDETNQAWSEEDDFQVSKPRLNIEVKGKTQATWATILPYMKNIMLSLLMWMIPVALIGIFCTGTEIDAEFKYTLKEFLSFHRSHQS